MRSIKFTLTFISPLAVSAALLLGSCTRDKSKPGIEYMPDMYRGPAIETYQENTSEEGGAAYIKPVQNTIPRGHVPYEYPNTPEGYASAKQNLTNPLSELDSEETAPGSPTGMVRQAPVWADLSAGVVRAPVLALATGENPLAWSCWPKAESV